MSGKHKLHLASRSLSCATASSRARRRIYGVGDANACFATDEPRRSVRATKGQHTKSLDLLDQPVEPTKKRGGKKASAGKKAASQEISAAEDAEDVIRCVCGTTEQNDDADENWIACMKCDAWQHNVCMGVTTDKDVLQDMDYWCERCKPENHKELLDALARGEKLWDTRRKDYDNALAEAERSKKGKKGKAKRVSEMRAATPQISKAASPDTSAEVKKVKKEAVSRAGSTKRKTRDESHDEHLKVAKVRKVSSQQASPAPPEDNGPADLPKTISELDESRKRPTELLKKSLVVALKHARQNGNYQGSDTDLDPKAVNLALQIDRATHDAAISKNAYTSQMRKLIANLKTNQELCDRLLAKTLAPKELAVMTDDDMASKELQRQTAEMKARAEKQAIMVTEDEGPRIRRTHKGDEVIEADNYIASTEEMPASRRRSMADPNYGMGARSRENTPDGDPEGVELPMDIDEYHSQDNIRGNAQSPPQLAVNTRGSPPSQRKASTVVDNFDINSVYSKVQSPTVTQHARKPSQPILPPQNLVQDADIDRLLDDVPEAQSPPYEPPEYEEDPSIVWRGSMFMTSIASFPATARHIAGADLSTVGIPWSDLLDDRLSVAGRIDPGKATEYLCSLRYSSKTDIAVVSLSPAGGDAAQQEFRQLFDYFHSKNRYGVVGSKTLANVRDTYLIPVAPGSDSGPEFLQNLDNNKLPIERTDPMMIIALVIREKEGQSDTARGYGDASPSALGPARTMSLGAQQGPAMSPIVPPGSSGPGVLPTPPLAAQGPNPPSELEKQQHADAQARGEAVAREILGEFVSAPTAIFLMNQAWRMHASEWKVIRQVFEEEEAARGDLRFLGSLLEVRGGVEGGAGGGANGNGNGGVPVQVPMPPQPQPQQ